MLSVCMSPAPLGPADITCISLQRQLMTGCILEYKFRVLAKKKKVTKYSERLRRLEVLNCCLSTSCVLNVNICVNACDISDI